MIRTPAFEAQVFCRAAIFEFFKHGLAFRPQKIVGQQQGAVGMGRLRGDGGAADVGRYDIHRHPFHRRALRNGVQGVVAEDGGRGEDLA